LLRKLLLPLGLSLLAACSSLPERTLSPLLADTDTFSLSARFALRQELPDGSQRNLNGRLNWSHSRDGDRLLLTDPLAQGIAELWQNPAGARIKLADGREFTAATAETLITQLLGYPLPISQMPGWLTGRQASQRDTLGRAQRLEVKDWHISYTYDSDAANAPPARITLTQVGQGELAGMELRLRIEEWNSTP